MNKTNKLMQAYHFKSNESFVVYSICCTHFLIIKVLNQTLILVNSASLMECGKRGSGLKLEFLNVFSSL